MAQPRNVKLPKRIATEALREALGDKRRFEDIMLILFGERVLPRKKRKINVDPEMLRQVLAVVSDGEEGESKRRTAALVPASFRLWFQQSPRARRAFITWAKRRLAGEDTEEDEEGGQQQEEAPASTAAEPDPVEPDPEPEAASEAEAFHDATGFTLPSMPDPQELAASIARKVAADVADSFNEEPGRLLAVEVDERRTAEASKILIPPEDEEGTVEEEEAPPAQPVDKDVLPATRVCTKCGKEKSVSTDRNKSGFYLVTNKRGVKQPRAQCVDCLLGRV